MSAAIELAKQLLSPPGDTLQESLDEIGMSQAELAERMGRPKEKINDLIHGREPISTTTAFQLEKVLGIPASFWMNREKEYRRRLYELEQRAELEGGYHWLLGFPVRQLKSLGILPNTREKAQLVNALLQFFGIASPAEWEKIYVSAEVAVSFRLSLAHTQSPQSLSAWLRLGEIEAAKLHVPPFAKAKFRKALQIAKEIAYQHPDDFAERLQQLCLESGVALVFTPCLPKTPVSGATRWFRGNPLIQLSGRYKTNDHFWFTFFHEAGHILLHRKKDIFLENVKGTEVDKKKEEEADAFAARTLLNERQFEEIVSNETVNDDVILAYARKFKVHPGIIIGRLQYEGVIQYSEGNDLKKKINLH